VSVEAMVEIRPLRGLPERLWLTEGGAPKQALWGTAEVRILGEGGEAPAGSPALLAALEVERLRGVLVEAVIPLEALLMAGCLRPSATALSQAVKDGILEGIAAVRSALSAPPPDLGPLRELVAAGLRWINYKPRSPQDDEHICGLIDAIDAARAVYPCLGEE
jgi:hypothetical protein